MTALPDWLMERALLDEVPSPCRARVDEYRSTDTYAEQSRALVAHNQRVLGDLPVAEVVAEIHRRAAMAERRQHAPGPARWLRFAAPALVTAAASAALILWIDRSSNTSDQAPLVASASERDAASDPLHRIKGGPRLVVHKQVGVRSLSLDSGAQVQAGDRLQVYYTGIPAADGAATPTSSLYGMIISIDGRGSVTVHLPDSGAMTTGLHGPGPTPLTHSYQLDDAPEFEHFALITGPAPFAVEDVVQAARAWVAGARTQSASAPALDLSPSLQQTWFLLAKGDAL